MVRTFTVTNNEDSGAGSLRQAILDANAYDAAAKTNASVIDFVGSIGTITLLSPLQPLNYDAASNVFLRSRMTIDGSGATGTVTVNGNMAQRVFFAGGGQISVICCVRNPALMVDSLERLIRRNSLDLSAIFGFDAGGTVYSRSEGLLRGDGMVGFARNAVREAFYGQEADRLIMLQYETLTASPAAAMALLYDLLDEPHFAHDFENIAFDEPEFDTRLGTPGLHQVARRVHATPRPTILPPDLFSRCEPEAFWGDESANPKNVVII